MTIIVLWPQAVYRILLWSQFCSILDAYFQKLCVCSFSMISTIFPAKLLLLKQIIHIRSWSNFPSHSLIYCHCQHFTPDSILYRILFLAFTIIISFFFFFGLVVVFYLLYFYISPTHTLTAFKLFWLVILETFFYIQDYWIIDSDYQNYPQVFVISGIHDSNLFVFIYFWCISFNFFHIFILLRFL